MTAATRTVRKSFVREAARRRHLLAGARCRCAVKAVAFTVALSHLNVAEPAAAQALLRPETVEAFDRYAHGAERQFLGRLAGESPFLWSLETLDRSDRVLSGRIVVEPSSETGWLEIEGGLVHDWTAAVLVPGSRVEQVVSVVTAYDTHAITYAPAVLRSRILDRHDGKYRVAMRMVAKNVLTAVLETEHLAEYAALDGLRWWGRSRSVSIREVDHPGSGNESLRPPGEDSGFLWRLHVYWRFVQTEGGVIAEHRAISLTRSLPRALRWMLRPLLVALPTRSLRDMMRITRDVAVATAQ